MGWGGWGSDTAAGHRGDARGRLHSALPLPASRRRPRSAHPSPEVTCPGTLGKSFSLSVDK